MNLASGTIVAHFRILKKLGSGAMGVVYAAEDTRLKRTVALKFINPDWAPDQQARERFIREAQTASSLDHPNICGIHEIAEEGGALYFVMNYYAGMTLTDYLQCVRRPDTSAAPPVLAAGATDDGPAGGTDPETAPLTISRIIDIAQQIASGLQAAHSKNLVHCDIKPANILITAEGTAKILDFGVSRLATAPTTDIRGGTLAYMSPEQIEQQPIDQRSDIWSFGVLLFELVCGRRPFDEKYDSALCYAILNTTPDFDLLRQAGASAQLIALIAAALARNREERPPSMTEMIAALDKIGIESRKGRLRRFMQKWWPVAAMLPLLIIAISRFLPDPPEPRLTEQVILEPFINSTGHPIFDHAITTALKYTLGQSSHISLLPADRIAAARQRLQMPPSESLAGSDLLAIARSEGADMVITGRIDAVGARYVVSAEITAAGSGQIIRIERLEIKRLEEALGGIDDLARRIRHSLGESGRDIAHSALPLEKVSSFSLQAIDYYSRGTLLEAQGKFAEAAACKEKAVAIDSQFTMAISDLSYYYRKLGDNDRAMRYHRRVLPLISRLTERERFSTLMTYYGPYFEARYDTAMQIARQFTIIYPNDAAGWAFLGHLAMYVGDYTTALAADTQAVAVDSALAGTCFNNAGFASAMRGRGDQALRFFRLSKTLRPNYLTIDLLIARAFWLQNLPDSAHSAISSALEHAQGLEAAACWAEKAVLYYGAGQTAAARAVCAKGLELCRQEKRMDEAAWFYYLEGEFDRARGDREGAIANLQLAMQHSRSPFFDLALAGVALAQMGESDLARQARSRLAANMTPDPYFTRRQTAYLHLIQGEILLQQNESARAVAEFDQVEPVYVHDPFYLLAQKEKILALLLQSPPSAEAPLKEFETRRGEITFATLPALRQCGPWIGELAANFQAELGLVFARRGDFARAGDYLSRALQSWPEADSDYQLAVRAKSELARIRNIE